MHNYCTIKHSIFWPLLLSNFADVFSARTKKQRQRVSLYTSTLCQLTNLISKIQQKGMSQDQINEIAEAVTANALFCTKEVLTSDEAAKYMGISKSYLYKLTMRGEIPHYKPMGKMCYFNRAELEQWLQQNRCATATEITDRANRFCMKGGKV